MDLSLFHFLRPYWLLLIPVWLIAAWYLARSRAPQQLWKSICDDRLIPFVITEPERQGRGRGLFFFLGLWGLLISLALAGPTWKQKPVPVWQPQIPLVVLFDASKSMDASDLKPNRLKRARYKLQDLFEARKGSPVALVAFSAQPFVLSPLSDDSDTLSHLSASLSTALVPVQGSRLDRAINKARGMIRGSGHDKGDILLITDEHRASSEALRAANAAANDGIRLSVLAVGGEAGAPIPAGNGGFIRDARGELVLTRPDEDFLEQLASQGGGRYVRLSGDNRDLETLLAGFHDPELDTALPGDLSINQWYDFGPWLVLPLLLLAALAFRRGLVFLIPLLMLPYPRAEAMDWQALWHNDDQRGYQAFEDGDYATASERFSDPRWRSSALYKAGDYEAAVKAQGEPESADDWYNRGNMLARTGRLTDAIQAYDQALTIDPEHEDASYNKSLLEQQQGQEQTENQQQDRQQESNGQSQEQKPQQASGEDQQGEENTEPSSGEQHQEEQQTASGDESQKPGQDGSSEEEQSDQQQAAAEPQQQQEQHPDEQPQNREATEQETQAQGDPERQSALEEAEAADEAWLRQIPDDPGNLMQRLFRYEAQEQRYRSEKEAW